jgi:hypothetical protein
MQFDPDAALQHLKSYNLALGMDTRNPYLLEKHAAEFALHCKFETPQQQHNVRQSMYNCWSWYIDDAAKKYQAINNPRGLICYDEKGWDKEKENSYWGLICELNEKYDESPQSRKRKREDEEREAYRMGAIVDNDEEAMPDLEFPSELWPEWEEAVKMLEQAVDF